MNGWVECIFLEIIVNRRFNIGTVDDDDAMNYEIDIPCWPNNYTG